VTPLSNQVLSTLLHNFQHLLMCPACLAAAQSFSFERPWTLRSNVTVFRNYAGACVDDVATDSNSKLQLTAHAAVVSAAKYKLWWYNLWTRNYNHCIFKSQPGENLNCMYIQQANWINWYQQEVEISWQVDYLSSIIKIKISIFKTDGTQHWPMLPSIPCDADYAPTDSVATRLWKICTSA